MFEFGCDPASNAMAGTKPRTREAFFEAWAQHFNNSAIRGCVIILSGQVVGSIACFQADNRDNVGYWIARSHWGQGIASRALELFLKLETRRPLHATACVTNLASHRILEKCGFRKIATRHGEETDRYQARTIADFVLE